MPLIPFEKLLSSPFKCLRFLVRNVGFWTFDGQNTQNCNSMLLCQHTVSLFCGEIDALNTLPLPYACHSFFCFTEVMACSLGSVMQMLL